ncbi:F0F1 ATP synthase subunit delta [Candidatus Kaiserbacteria bacterium]|nr:F0F1 ATP synthase subunit delta [Candidatus Kaiserbacteria bacterium]
MRARDYIEAAYQALQDGKDISEVLTGLYATLENRGHQKLKAQILSGLLTYIEEKERSTAPELRLAKEEDAKKLSVSIKEALKELGAEEEPRVSIDAKHIGGYTATYNGKRIDRSYKSALLQLYKNITS